MDTIAWIASLFFNLLRQGPPVTSKFALTLLSAALLATASIPVYAAPTPDQQKEIDGCGVMAKAVLLFAEARDQGQSKDDAFKSVTHGQADVPGSAVDRTLQWAYDHPREQPEAATGHFYARCVLTALDLLTPTADAQIQSNVDGCVRDNTGRPELVRYCIDDMTKAIVDSGGVPEHAPPAGTAPVPAAAAAKVAHARPPSLTGIGKITLGMPLADAKKSFGYSGDQDFDEHGQPEYTYMISHGHGFMVILTSSDQPDQVYGVQINGGADVDMDPIMGIRLGDSSFSLLTKVGEPTGKTPIPNSDNTLWSYDDRNYSFILSSGGDLICIRVYGYTGLPTPGK